MSLRLGIANREKKAQPHTGVQHRNRAPSTPLDRFGQNMMLHEGRTGGKWQSMEGEKLQRAERETEREQETCRGSRGKAEEKQKLGVRGSK